MTEHSGYPPPGYNVFTGEPMPPHTHEQPKHPPFVDAFGRPLEVHHNPGFDPGFTHTFRQHQAFGYDSARPHQVDALVMAYSAYGGLKHAVAANPTEFLVNIQHDGDIIDPTSNIKENHMQTKLRTPSESIERKDLVIALALSDVRGEDELMHAIALVQDLKEGQSLTRGFWLKKKDIVGKYVVLVGKDVAGVCTDFIDRDQNRNASNHQLVLDGVITEVSTTDFLVVEAVQDRVKLGSITYPSTDD